MAYRRRGGFRRRYRSRFRARPMRGRGRRVRLLRIGYR